MKPVISWRIAKNGLGKNLWAGTGARLYGGRWNSVGNAVIYTASSPALAQLEMLAHLDSDEMLGKYVMARASFNASMVTLVEKFARLPKNWRAEEAPPSLKAIGDRWLSEMNSAVLSVPSAISPLDRNFLINPQHPDFSKFQLDKPFRFRFDHRLA